ncbi:DUF1643 domain-containing protein [Roseovarius sp. EL26]|uniref:DUF1643 domain-containing protein n=1 Tax=Roseovarius sp. EL26 TaxID=2126672 RepID=UPI0020B1413B|nr:DUF1643 domain-containing protein [Roseovarius sp. EL26]
MSAPEEQHDPGGKVRLKLPDGVIGGARFSDCGKYRQALTREWTVEGESARTILFIGMNPSVADASVSDPTCHRELDFSRRWGFNRYLKGNVLDWRATSPKDLPVDPAEACSVENIPYLQGMAEESELIVLAYGKLHKRYQPVIDEVVAGMRSTGKPLRCFARNKDGSAKHPLYLRKDAELIDYV